MGFGISYIFVFGSSYLTTKEYGVLGFWGFGGDETVAFKKAAPGMDISSKERKKEHRGSMKNARVKKLGSKKAFFDI